MWDNFEEKQNNFSGTKWEVLAVKVEIVPRKSRFCLKFSLFIQKSKASRH